MVNSDRGRRSRRSGGPWTPRMVPDVRLRRRDAARAGHPARPAVAASRCARPAPRPRTARSRRSSGLLTAQAVPDELAGRPAAQGAARPASSSAATRSSSTWPRGPSPASTGAARSESRRAGGHQGPPPAVHPGRRVGRALQPRGRGRHEAGPPEHRPDPRLRRPGQPPLHDHGVRRGLQPPRLPPLPPPARAEGGDAADARPGPGAAALARARASPTATSSRRTS